MASSAIACTCVQPPLPSKKNPKGAPFEGAVHRLVPRAGKTNQILSCDWLPERARWSYPYYKSFIDQALSVKMAVYWPRSFFASLWTSTPSRFINMQNKKNLANIQLPGPHTWSITHTYKHDFFCHFTVKKTRLLLSAGRLF